MKKRVMVSRGGLTACPSCLSHIEVAGELEQTECPFCDARLVAARHAHGERFGGGVMLALRASRSAALATALGAGLSMAACSAISDPGPPAEPVYGAPATMDMISPPDDDAGADMEVEADMAEDNLSQPEYGAPAFDE